MSLVRAQHSADWDGLPEERRGQIVWEKLVRPQVGDKYDSFSQERADVRVFPVIGLKTGEKVVTDEDATNNAHSRRAGSWRDEHSAPFSWETRSQLNMRISQSVDEVDRSESKAEPHAEPKADPQTDPPKAAVSGIAESGATDTHRVVDARPVEARVANGTGAKVAEPRTLESRLPQMSKSQESMSSVASRGSSNPPTPGERKGGRRRAPTPPKAPPPDPPRPKMAPPNPPATTVVAPTPVVKSLPDVPKKHPSSKPPAPPVPKVKVPIAEVPQPTNRGAGPKPLPPKPAPVADDKPLPKADDKPVPKADKPVPKADDKPVPKADDKPVAMAPAKERPNTVHGSEVTGIPKTGFDFLDNW